MPANVRVASSWKTVAAMHTRVGGSWKNVTEGYTRVGGAWKAFFTSVVPLTVDHLVIAGGGGGGGYIGNGGGGGAGGYRTSAGTSGGGASAESRVTVAVATNYTVTVGAGGTGMGSGQVATAGNGSNSVFSTITSTGGGGGGGYNNNVANAPRGANGGSGGGAWSWAAQGGVRGLGTANQGFDGGLPTTRPGDYAELTGGGGGAGSAGGNGDGSACGSGGAGVASSITGTSVTRAGGGGGGKPLSGSAAGAGGSGGGGAGGSNASPNGVAGTANTGGGGGGNSYTSTAINPQTPGNGGSGVVILRYPSNYAINPSPGLSHRTITSGGFNITSFTAGTGTVSFSQVSANAYELIQTVYLTGSQASVTFDVSGLASDYQHLQIRTSLRSNNGAVWEETKLTFNGSSSGYRSHLLGGTGSSVFSTWSDTTSTYLKPWAFAVGANATANVFGAAVLDILDPFETTKNKTVRCLGGRVPANGETRIALSSGFWENTATVTSITIAPEAGSQWVSGSRFSIYGLKGS